MRIGALALASAILLSVFLAAGCVSENENPQQNATDVPAGPAKTMPLDVQNDNGGLGAGNEPVAPVAAPEENANPDGSCNVSFQMGAGETYYTMVKTGYDGEITVRCPDGEMAARSGNAFFCQKLSLPKPVVAYLDGKACASALFSSGSKQPEGGATAVCAISVAPRRAIAGDELAITVFVSTNGAKATLSYDCNGAERSVKVNGIYDEMKMCRFNTPGSFEISARLDGVPCAKANVTIYATKRGCSVQNGPMNRTVENGMNVYRGTVFGHGYGINEELYYRCFGEAAGVRIGNIPNSADFEYTVECRSKSALLEPVRVTISKEECGSINP